MAKRGQPPNVVAPTDLGAPSAREAPAAWHPALPHIRETRNCMAPIHSPSQAEEPLGREGYHIARWLWGHVSRAQRSTTSAFTRVFDALWWCAADPGPERTPRMERSRISGEPREQEPPRYTESGTRLPAWGHV